MSREIDVLFYFFSIYFILHIYREVPIKFWTLDQLSMFFQRAMKPLALYLKIFHSPAQFHSNTLQFVLLSYLFQVFHTCSINCFVQEWSWTGKRPAYWAYSVETVYYNWLFFTAPIQCHLGFEKANTESEISLQCSTIQSLQPWVTDEDDNAEHPRRLPQLLRRRWAQTRLRKASPVFLK